MIEIVSPVGHILLSHNFTAFGPWLYYVSPPRSGMAGLFSTGHVLKSLALFAGEILYAVQ